MIACAPAAAHRGLHPPAHADARERGRWGASKSAHAVSSQVLRMFELLALSVFPGAMAFAGSMDLMTMTIPNRISIALVIGFFIIAPLAGMGLGGLALHAAVGAGVLAVGFFMFARGWIGGGDAKLLAATSLWFGLEKLGEFLMLTVLLGGGLSLALLLYRLMPLAQPLQRIGWVARLHRADCGIPYGVAIAGAALMLYPSIPWVAAHLL